ncbi:MAG: class II fructose-bisphosphatase [Ardenticatenia bacterium]|nr:MAG: class II fructose-bisphosphatase [Ardenticatenia bacterium]
MKPEARNFGLELIRATEAAALAAGAWMGKGNMVVPDAEAASAMYDVLNSVEMEGYILLGEERKTGEESPLATGRRVGTGDGPKMDVVADPIDGRKLVAQGLPGALAFAAIAPYGTMWRPRPAVYMEKLIVNHEAASVLVPECLDAPAAWTLALIARAKGKQVGDLVVFVLDRPRHHDLIAEIRSAGAHIMLRSDGDVAGAILAALADDRVDVLMGIGGVVEGTLAACAVRAMGGGMLGRLAPQTKAEYEAVTAAGLDLKRVFTCADIVQSDDVYFAATGITDGPLLDGVVYSRHVRHTHSLVLRGVSRTRREIRTEHWSEFFEKRIC